MVADYATPFLRQIYPRGIPRVIEESTFKLASWNVNSVRSFCEKLIMRQTEGSHLGPLSFFEQYLLREGYGVVCLQETMLGKKENHYTAFHNLEHYHTFANDRRTGRCGLVTLVSKDIPVTHMCEGLDLTRTFELGAERPEPDPSDEGRALVIFTTMFTIVNVYVPNGAHKECRQDTKMEFLRQLYHTLSELRQHRSGIPVLVCGDFNVAHQPRDALHPLVYEKYSGFRLDERQLLTDIMNLGYTDGFRKTHAFDQCFTWRSPQEHFTPIWRIDYILIDNRFAGNWRVAHRWLADLTDHACVVLTIQLNPDAHHEAEDVLLSLPALTRDEPSIPTDFAFFRTDLEAFKRL
ncbi:hypothetical protein HK101_005809 [Irineochytrium annulatum]|nr:hypothetical protein HK101_005809 [Irineochytrium annulatum]